MAITQIKNFTQLSEILQNPGYRGYPLIPCLKSLPPSQLWPNLNQLWPKLTGVIIPYLVTYFVLSIMSTSPACPILHTAATPWQYPPPPAKHIPSQATCTSARHTHLLVGIGRELLAGIGRELLAGTMSERRNEGWAWVGRPEGGMG